ncbi:hypothetical protein [Vitiosangium sp. GDMCC 1.1324]|uniref:hypothetical protein n=1 Tax=Vitiosangium sp. (strain GDMCC 1.1324) TaxID=2138576 RepID=UPI0011B560A1|nr:hypothetical protein [Vitiosangium sp. GDMCC 1.1324]
MRQRLGWAVVWGVAGAAGLLPLESGAQNVPPSVIFLLDNSKSMQDFPEYLPEAFTPGYDSPPPIPLIGDHGYDGDFGHFINTGCSDPALVSAMSWFDKDSSDTKKNGSIIYDNDADFGSTPMFEPNKFYHSRGRRLAWQRGEYPFSLIDDFRHLDGASDSLTACFQVVGWTGAYWGTTVMNECQSCLANKGWWRGPMVSAKTQVGYNGPTREFDEPPLPPEAYRKWIVSGRVLNVRPPRFVIARKALKEVIATASNVRMGVATFGADHGWFDPPQLLASLRPSCDQSMPVLDEAALNRPLLMQSVNTAVFRNNERSLGEALFGLGGYFSSQRQDNLWTNWFKQPLNPGYFGWPGCCNGGTYDNPYTGQTGATYAAGSDEWLKLGFTDPSTGTLRPGQPWEGYGLDKSVCFNTQTSAVIALTAGRPYYDNSVPITRMMALLKADGARHPDGTLLRFDPVNPETNPDVGGVNYCDQFERDPVTHEKYTKADCDYIDWNWPAGLGVGNKNFMDDVAFFLSHKDLRWDLPGSQSVRTFVVGYGDSSPMLQSVALAGRGQFYRADSPDELKAALLSALAKCRAPAGSVP